MSRQETRSALGGKFLFSVREPPVPYITHVNEATLFKAFTERGASFVLFRCAPDAGDERLVIWAGDSQGVNFASRSNFSLVHSGEPSGARGGEMDRDSRGAGRMSPARPDDGNVFRLRAPHERAENSFWRERDTGATDTAATSFLYLLILPFCFCFSSGRANRQSCGRRRLRDDAPRFRRRKVGRHR